jgi:serine/threonine-protein kinase
VVTVGGRTSTLKIGVAKKPSGLYRSTAQVRGARIVTGWIVLPGGRQVGMSNDGATETPAPPLDLTNRTATLNGVPVTAVEIDGETTNGFPP